MMTDWLCLEFTKTVGWESRDRPDDRLQAYDNLVSWGLEHRCIDELGARELLNEAAARPEDAARVVNRAIALRALVYRIFRTIGDGEVPRAAELEALNGHVRDALARRRIEQHDGSYVWGWRWEGDRLDLILNMVVVSAADLLTSAEAGRVRHCEGDGCGWLFIDGSRNQSRRWCDMSDCGNRAKAERFRRRRKRVQKRRR